jgi:hypothetical protein
MGGQHGETAAVAQAKKWKNFQPLTDAIGSAI